MENFRKRLDQNQKDLGLTQHGILIFAINFTVGGGYIPYKVEQRDDKLICIGPLEI